MRLARSRPGHCVHAACACFFGTFSGAAAIIGGGLARGGVLRLGPLRQRRRQVLGLETRWPTAACTYRSRGGNGGAVSLLRLAPISPAVPHDSGAFASTAAVPADRGAGARGASLPAYAFADLPAAAAALSAIARAGARGILMCWTSHSGQPLSIRSVTHQPDPCACRRRTRRRSVC